MNQNDIKKSLQYRDNFSDIKHVKTYRIKKAEIVNPAFSIVIPTYQRTELLEEAVDSALNQYGVINYEIVIVDDNFQERCPTQQLILSKYGDKKKIAYYKNKENVGMFNNWNRCYELARAEWVCMLHDDDILKPSYLITLIDAINKDKDHTILFANSGEIIVQRYNSFILSFFRLLFEAIVKSVGSFFTDDIVRVKLLDFCIGDPIKVQAFALKKDIVLEIGGFGSNYYAEDYIFFTKLYLSHKGPMKIIDKPLASYRIFVNTAIRFKIDREIGLTNYYLINFLLKKINKSLFIRRLIKLTNYCLYLSTMTNSTLLRLIYILPRKFVFLFIKLSRPYSISKRKISRKKVTLS